MRKACNPSFSDSSLLDLGGRGATSAVDEITTTGFVGSLGHTGDETSCCAAATDGGAGAEAGGTGVEMGAVTGAGCGCECGAGAVGVEA